ncbi:M16 family metallopeptidase [Bhargavaea cecembensis]|uniref:M16 family metallopeptidase n=1 Tax=Bhargavaea cecembensis TaxID=394098 RepID=UPI00058DBF97|nr:pitrilysin family protein [Bhargavaea cecembensis]
MIKKLTLPNGVRIVHESMPTVRSVSAGIWVKAGSRNEAAGEEGIAHFIEHMLFKGTARRSARDIAVAFDRTGGDVNAFTSMEETCYFMKVLDEHASDSLEVLADMFFHSLFDAEEMEKEKSVITEEIAMVEDDPEDDVHEQLMAAMYPEHPMGRPILGTKESVRSFTEEQARNFMSRHYRPENTVISLAGKIDDSLIAKAAELFGGWKPSGLRSPALAPPAFQAGNIRKKREAEQAHLCIGFPGLDVNDPDIYALIVLNGLLGGSMSSRLFQSLREEKGLAYSIYSYHSSYSDSGSVTIYGGTSPDRLGEMQEAIDAEIRNLLKSGATSAELEDAAGQMRGSMLLGLENPGARMSRNGKNELFTGEHKTPEEVMESFAQVEKEQVDRLARDLLSGPRATAIILPS